MQSRIVLVPGLLSSRLVDAEDREVWANPATLATTGFDDLRLGNIDPNFPIPPGRRMSPGSLLPNTYQPAIDELNSRAFGPVQTFLYDWRASISISGLRLSTFLRQQFPTGDYQIICHSLGGLVTRYAMMRLHQNGWNKPNFVLGVGVPHGGSFDAISALTGSEPTFMGIFADLDWYAQVAGNAAFPGAGYILSGVYTAAVRAAALSCLRTWPAMYHLLPWHLGRWSGNANVARVWTEAFWDGVPIDATLLAHALEVGTQLSAAVPNLPPWHDIRGTGQPTITGLIGTRAVDPLFTNSNTGGDRRVEFDRAWIGQGSSTAANAIHHSTIQEWVYGAISELFAKKDTIPPLPAPLIPADIPADDRELRERAPDPFPFLGFIVGPPPAIPPSMSSKNDP